MRFFDKINDVAIADTLSPPVQHSPMIKTGLSESSWGGCVLMETVAWTQGNEAVFNADLARARLHKHGTKHNVGTFMPSQTPTRDKDWLPGKWLCADADGVFK